MEVWKISLKREQDQSLLKIINGDHFEK